VTHQLWSWSYGLFAVLSTIDNSLEVMPSDGAGDAMWMPSDGTRDAMVWDT
jgi:hypothetical protein